MLLAMIYVPFLQEIFQTAPVPVTLWLLLLVWPPFLLGADEVRNRNGQAPSLRWLPNVSTVLGTIREGRAPGRGEYHRHREKY